MIQQSLFFDDIYEALTADIQALGGNKRVGAEIWPAKSPEKAAELLSSCLNRSRPEKLDPEQINYIIKKSRQVSAFATMSYFAEQANFKPPEPVEPEDEKARLQREFIEAVKLQQAALAKIEQLTSGG